MKDGAEGGASAALPREERNSLEKDGEKLKNTPHIFQNTMFFSSSAERCGIALRSSVGRGLGVLQRFRCGLSSNKILEVEMIPWNFLGRSGGEYPREK